MAGPVLVGTQKNSGSSGTTSVAVTLPGAITAGNMLVALAVTDDGTAPTTTGITDTTGSNVWTRVSSLASGSAVGSCAIFVCLNAAAGSYAITFTNATAFVALSAAEFNPNGQSGTDGTNGSSSGSTTTVDPGAISTTNASDSIFVVGTDATSTTSWTAGTGYTLLSCVNSAANTNVGAQYQSFSTTVTAQSTAFGNTATSGWAASAAAVKAAAGGATVVDEDEGVQYYPSTWGFAL